MKTQPTTAKKTTTPKKQVSSVSYSFNDERQIVRQDGNDSTVLATLSEDGALEYATKDTRKLHQAVIRFLNDEKIAFNPERVTTAAGEDNDEEEVDAGELEKEASPEYNKKIPAAPRTTPESGDKTPAYVDWLKKYKPATFAAKYGVIGPGRVTKFRKTTNPENGRPMTVPYQVDAVISTRKTHLTEKRDAADVDVGEEAGGVSATEV